MLKSTKQHYSIAAFGLAMASALLATAPSYADTTGSTISSNVGASISLFTTSGTVNINTSPTAAGVQTIASDTVTVSTNDTAGYTLKLNASSATTALTSGANTIAASSGTQASPVAMAVNTWGYRVVGVGGFGSTTTSTASNQAIGSLTFAGVPASGSPNTLKTTAATANSDVTTVWYGVATNTSKPSGTYTVSVTYTATAN